MIEYNVLRADTRNASGKAKYDCSDILNQIGFSKLYKPSTHRPIRVLQQFANVLRIEEMSIVAIQYPGNIDFFYHLLGKKQLCKIAILHDLESLREIKQPEEECQILDSFDCLISHNPAMTDYIKKIGCKTPIVNLGFFDYLVPDGRPEPKRMSCRVCYAGNLSKSAFIQDLGEISSLQFELFGLPEPGRNELPGNVSYRGSFPADQIPLEFEGSWGLVWDGDTVTTCGGPKGEYLRFNCPHKASSYIAAGLPLIVWRESAIAGYVENLGLGLCVSSLQDAAERISRMSEDEYQSIADRVKTVQSDLLSGLHLKIAMQKALEAASLQYVQES